VLVSGGYSGGATGYSSSAEIYDPALGTWSLTGSMSTGRAFHTAALLPDGRVLVSGGRPFGDSPAEGSAEIYDPTLRTWSPTGSMASMPSGMASSRNRMIIPVQAGAGSTIAIVI